MQNFVSVIIPTYEHAETIGACLDAVFAQTYSPIEVIVVDDGSTDNTQEVLKQYVGKIISIKQENQGSNPTRNRGLQEAKGEFVIFVDADVIMVPDMLEKMKKSLDEHPEASYAYSGFSFGWKTFWGTAFSAEKLKKMNFIHSTSLVRRADFPGFDNAIKRLQDWDVWLTMLEHGKKGILVPGVLFKVGIHGTSRIGSAWLPKFAYQIPWNLSPWKPTSIKKYEAAREIIAKKHHL